MVGIARVIAHEVVEKSYCRPVLRLCVLRRIEHAADLTETEMGEPHFGDEPLVVGLLSDELAVERLCALQQLAPERLHLRYIRADTLLIAIGGYEQLSHRLGRETEVALRAVPFTARDVVEPPDAERNNQKECGKASREYQPPQASGSPFCAHASTLLLAEIEKFHGAIERVAVSSRPRGCRP